MNSSTTDNGDFECPEWEVDWPIDNWPVFNQQLGLALFLLMCITVVASLSFMWIRRNREPYRSRNPVLLSIYAIALLGIAVNMSVREFIGRDNYPCAVSLWLNYTTVALWMGPHAVQLLQLKNRLEWQDKLEHMPINAPIDVSFTEYAVSKYRAGNTRAYLVMGLYLALMIALTLGYAFAYPVYISNCMGCNLGMVDFIVYSTLFLCCLFSIYVAMRRVPEPASGQSEQPMITEQRQVFKIYVPLYLAYVVISLIDPGNYENTGVLAWNHFAVLVLTILVFHTIAWPGIRVMMNAELIFNVNLADVLQDPELLEMFETHLKSEFSLENLRFYDEARSLKRSFPSGHVVTEQAMETWKSKALGVYQTFMASDGILAVNISAPIRRKVELSLGIVNTEHNLFNRMSGRLSQPDKHISGGGMEDDMHVPDSISGDDGGWLEADVFDAAVREIYKLMEDDSFGRFCNVYKEYLEKGGTVHKTHRSRFESSGAGSEHVSASHSRFMQSVGSDTGFKAMMMIPKGSSSQLLLEDDEV